MLQTSSTVDLRWRYPLRRALHKIFSRDIDFIERLEDDVFSGWTTTIDLHACAVAWKLRNDYRPLRRW
jgi:hypothetical protein